ncbi:uncharacterized protein V1510DRAFT_407756 [Dipodascopsis tothii]|uniref:uncharacterized protein n=1 Tax=Dipodascopsis tothii TaxID=44089 RepID=UPI0034CF26DD
MWPISPGLVVYYVDRRAKCAGSYAGPDAPVPATEDATVAGNVRCLLGMFPLVSVYASGPAFLARAATRESRTPGLVLLDDPSNLDPSAGNTDGCRLLQSVLDHNRLFPAFVAVILTDSDSADKTRLVEYLELGAADVLPRTLSHARLQGLLPLLYRHARAIPVLSSKLSWVSSDQRVCTVYDRDQIIDEIMQFMLYRDPLCLTQRFASVDGLLSANGERLRQRVFTWDFAAYELSDDELLVCAYQIFQHALRVESLAEFVISPACLLRFLTTTRAAYQPRNPYHNFRHAVDVLQATFYFLLSAGVFPTIDGQPPPPAPGPHSFAAVLRPRDGLALLIAAMGHDTGHPGVTNAFLNSTNSPLSLLYSGRSVLESFHCAAYNNLLQLLWPATHSVAPVRDIIVETVLATDMGVHFKYMKKLTKIFEDPARPRSLADLPDPIRDHYRILICASLMKCADISNVARNLEISTHWGKALSDEFELTACLEQAVTASDTNLVACMQSVVDTRKAQRANESEDDRLLALAKSQIFFIDTFARPLFRAMVTALPELQYTLDNVIANGEIWRERIAAITTGVASTAQQ